MDVYDHRTPDPAVAGWSATQQSCMAAAAIAFVACLWSRACPATPRPIFVVVCMCDNVAPHFDSRRLTEAVGRCILVQLDSMRLVWLGGTATRSERATATWLRDKLQDADLHSLAHMNVDQFRAGIAVWAKKVRGWTASEQEVCALGSSSTAGKCPLKAAFTISSGNRTNMEVAFVVENGGHKLILYGVRFAGCPGYNAMVTKMEALLGN